MKHLGDITKISGYSAPIVDCIIGGSPCQDLSVAGKRAGLDGERSGLYIEQVRIVKEMREKDEKCGRAGVDIRPRYMVWENVPGAFSSNKGEDFRIVLEELAKVKEPNAVIPMPDKWTNHGCIMGDGWSIAWRVLDAQFWGVPQRRRRIALVADFGGHSAPEILFVSKSVSGDIEPSEPKRETASSDAQGGIGTDDKQPKLMDAYQHHGWRESDTCGTLTAGQNNSVRGDTPLICCGIDGYNASLTGDKTATLGVNCDRATGRNRVLFVHLTQDPIASDKCAPCISAGNPHHGQATVGVCYSIQGNMVGRADKNGPQGDGVNEDVSFTLNTTDRHAVVFGIGSYHSNAWKSDNPHSGVYEADKAKTLDALNCGYPACNQGGMAVVAAVDCRNGSEDDVNGALQSNSAHSLNGNNVVRTRYIVRRLTPLECERLQGYPDGWTDIGEWVDSNGKKRQTSDAARYKALGNSIALPPWKWVLKRICACYERDATMASLFDGIGGFPYLWEQLNGKGTCLWASEIEEFPMAVTKVRIGEDT